MTEYKRETMTDRSVIYFARLNRVIFFWPLALLIAAIYLYYQFQTLREVSLFLGGFALLWIAMTWVTYYFSSLVIKKNQVILRTGLLVRKTIDIPLNKIESIDISQTIIGSIFRYGTLVITGTGGTRHLINYLCKPLTCRRYIEQLMNESHR
ncbi:PH domain-containing protein [Legionella israelensis]|uniref:PH domain-containing protein n=3 Tax=Legionella israelensis TaxID=454 RepID=A0A0W0WJK2_9GAMM|nr:PH domain-containing protein [Legionella israelensis]KTD32497.1 transmembrane protein [Legionella israelensis]QBR85407.1 PH domain-containing protein [Legionella israelensis]QBS10231.1 PH domain-containing protein [Legionella israelensis]SCY32906.1 PH domain-containing protein [Legionella israelensis DSM 19235]STX59824.1 transmembrane protein [Legionella israelensis]